MRGQVDFVVLNDTARRLIQILKPHNDNKQVLRITPLLQRFAMDCVCRIIFDVDLRVSDKVTQTAERCEARANN